MAFALNMVSFFPFLSFPPPPIYHPPPINTMETKPNIKIHFILEIERFVFFFFSLLCAVFSSANSPCQLSINHGSAESLMKLVNGFLIAITCRGNIVIVTPSIEQHLGHCQVNDQTFFHFDTKINHLKSGKSLANHWAVWIRMRKHRSVVGSVFSVLNIDRPNVSHAQKDWICSAIFVDFADNTFSGQNQNKLRFNYASNHTLWMTINIDHFDNSCRSFVFSCYSFAKQHVKKNHVDNWTWTFERHNTELINFFCHIHSDNASNVALQCIERQEQRVV